LPTSFIFVRESLPQRASSSCIQPFTLKDLTMPNGVGVIAAYWFLNSLSRFFSRNSIWARASKPKQEYVFLGFVLDLESESSKQIMVAAASVGAGIRHFDDAKKGPTLHKDCPIASTVRFLFVLCRLMQDSCTGDVLKAYRLREGGRHDGIVPLTSTFLLFVFTVAPICL
jgi:hypothetical protein